MSEERTTAREIAQDETNKSVMLMLGRLEGKVDSVLANQQELHRITDDHEARIAANESDLTGIKVKVAVIGALIGAAISALGNWIWSRMFGHQ